MAQKFLTDIELTRGLKDSSGDLGNSGQVLSSTGSALNWVDNTASASVIYQDGFTGNGSTTAFTLANSIDNENKTQVYIDGVYQHKDTYSLSGTTLTFSTAPPNTSDIEVISFSTVTADGDILTDSEFSSAGLMTTNGSGVYSITTNNSSNWNTAYTYSQVGHLPLAGGTLTGAVVGTSFSAPSGFINGSNGGIRIHVSGTKFFNITAANAARDGIMDIGASDARFKDLYLSGSITSGAITASGNIMPAAENAYNIGSASVRWEDLYVDDGYIRNAYIDDKIIHNGDADTWIHLETDVISLRTGGTDRLVLNNTTATITNDLHVGGTNKARFKTDGTNTIIDAIPGSSSIIFRNSGAVEKMRLDASGRLGIGITNPTVYGVHANNASNSVYFKSTSGSVETLYGGATALGGGLLGTTTNHPLIIYANNAERMRLDSSGNLGIGVTSPTQKLDVVGSGGDTNIRVYDSSANSEVGLKLQNDAKTWTLQNWGSGGDNLRLLNNAGNIVQLWDDNGKVGIGNFNDPSVQLHVHATSGDGLIRITGDNLTNSGGTIKGFNNGLAFNVAVAGGGGENEVVRITGATLVGISTTNPSEKLSVASGNVAINNSNSFMVGGATGDTIVGRLKNTAGVLNLEAASGRQIRLGNGNQGETMRINAYEQRVGIGTSAPSYKLQVNVTGNGETALAFMNSAVTADGNGSTNIRFVSASNNQWASASYSAYDHIWYGNGSERMRVHGSTGRVSIGSTTASANTLTLSGSDTELDLANTSTNGKNYRIASTSSGVLEFIDKAANVERMRIHSDGKIGIGVVPTNNFHVGGVSNYNGIEITGTGASRPSLKFSNINQGHLAQIYGTEGNAMVIATDGADAITINDSQNVYINKELEVKGAQIAAGTEVANNGTTTLLMRNYDATLTDAGDVQNMIRMTGRYWSGSNSQLVETRITSIHQIANGNGGSALGFETQHGGNAPSEKMRLDRNGNLGIATNSVNARLDVRGAVATGMATEDEEVSVTLNGGSQVSSGTLEMTQGWTGTMSSGDTIVFRYNAASWKSWALEFMFVSTNGMSDGKIGGYNNNSSGRTTAIGSNSHGMSISYSRDNAGGGTGQTNIITFTFTGLGIHPFCHFKYFQSGGDGRPVASKASITLNS